MARRSPVYRDDVPLSPVRVYTRTRRTVGWLLTVEESAEEGEDDDASAMAAAWKALKAIVDDVLLNATESEIRANV